MSRRGEGEGRCETYRTLHAARRERRKGAAVASVDEGERRGGAFNKWRNGGDGGVREREMQSAESTAGEGCDD